MFIDIHVHTRRSPAYPRKRTGTSYATSEQLIELYDKVGIEKAVLLPSVSPECSHGPQALEEILELCEEFAPRFIPFCNIDPRMIENAPDAPLDEMIAYYKEKGCKGVGEVCANLPFDNPLVENLFKACEKNEIPLTFHISPTIGGNYGLYDEPGLPLLEKALQKFPDLIFLGHSQAFWAEISPLEDLERRGGYPEGPVREGGRVVGLMRDYPNMHGDLSARSGFNAVSRDPEFGVSFLEEFQDSLYFGTDICAPPEETPPLVDFLLKMREEEKISEECFQKVSQQNAVRLLKLK